MLAGVLKRVCAQYIICTFRRDTMWGEGGEIVLLYVVVRNTLLNGDPEGRRDSCAPVCCCP